MSQAARKIRVAVAAILLVGAVVGWPLSALTWARDESQFILGLSWLAIIIEATTLLTSAQVHEEQGKE